MTLPPRMDRRSASWVTLSVLTATTSLVSSLGCTSQSVIALVIDTDMDVPGELDTVDISIAGPSRTAGPYRVKLTAAGAPPLPRTMGLIDGSSAHAVAITVVGLRVDDNMDTPPVTSNAVRTEFVEGETRMVRIVLSAACQGVTCDPATQTCSAGRCIDLAQPGRSLPIWRGTTPARPSAQPGEEALLWSAGWQGCAPKGGTLYCWGQNNVGQLGNDNVKPRVSRRLPVLDLVPKPAPPNSVGMGASHTCVCDAGSGLVTCWGDNTDGQLGQPPGGPQSKPVIVPGITECKAIAAGGAHTCVLRNNTEVWCWGRNAEAQLGLPASATPSFTPRMVPNLMGAEDIKAGERFTCATRTTGGVYCWGENNRGQLGDGTLITRSNNIRVNLPNNPTGTTVGVTEIALGRYFACALTDNQTVFCWGENTDGMAGPPPTVVTTPAQIADIADAIHIAAGHQHACAIRGPARTVWCWGSGQWGQLGNGLTANSEVPVAVSNLSDVTALTAGVVHTCARTRSGLFCWGQNVNGQLGDGSLLGASLPVHVVGF